MDNVTLKQLRYFDAVALHGHFGRAAEACAVTQPALSIQIRDLEQSLGHTLFDRGARKITLTTFGEAFAPLVRATLRSIDDIADLARAAQDQMIGRFKLGVIPTVAPYLLPRIIDILNRDFPGMDIHVRETLTPTLLHEMDQRKIDAAILALPIADDNLTEVPLFDENFVLVRAAGDAKKPVPNRDQLREMRLLLLEEGHCFRDQALAFCNLQPALGKGGLDASTLSTLVQMVAAGMGVTLIPEMAVPIETRAANVAITQFDAPEPRRTIGMIWRKNSPISDHLHKVADRLQQLGT